MHRILAAMAALVVGASLASLAAAAAPATAPEVRPYTDTTRGFTTMIPVGWSDPAGGLTTNSTDGTIHCTFTVTSNPRTISMDQDAINQSLNAYTAEVWKQQFFSGGTTGTIEVSGIVQLEAYAAPWARGMITYPGQAASKFGVLLVASPGKILTVTCLGTVQGYTDNVFAIGKVMNYLRPL